MSLAHACRHKRLIRTLQPHHSLYASADGAIRILPERGRKLHIVAQNLTLSAQAFGAVVRGGKKRAMGSCDAAPRRERSRHEPRLKQLWNSGESRGCSSFCRRLRLSILCGKLSCSTTRLRESY